MSGRPFAARPLPVSSCLLALGIAGFGSSGPVPLAAQEEAVPSAPEGWVVRTDRGGPAAAEGVQLMEMPPGWHVTTGPAAILYHPGKAAEGTYRLEAETYLFDPGQRREGYGIFFGGRNLDSEAQTYTYFLLRRDGRCLVKRRDGPETTVVQDWMEHPAIVGWDDRPDEAGQAKNVLAVEVGETGVAFLVNGMEVHRMPREGLPTDGVVGLRVNHSLNLHVTRLDVSPLEAGR